MSKLIMLSGLPASGKSTRAKEIQQGGGDFVRVNKDLIREMLHFGKWSGKNEKVVKSVEKEIARVILDGGGNVIVDDTNLREADIDSWRDFAKGFNSNNVSFYHEHIDTPVDVCIDRDSKRDKPVGRDVIMKFALQSGAYNPKMGAILVDIDGTVANLDHRLHLVQGDKPNWKEFFELCVLDRPRWDIIEKVKEYWLDGYDIFFVSGRSDIVRRKTEMWLDNVAQVPTYTGLFMRAEGDTRPDYEVKASFLKMFNKDDIKLVIDDRPQVIVNTWLPELGDDKIWDVGDDKYFKEEREKHNYWTNKE